MKNFSDDKIKQKEQHKELLAPRPFPPHIMDEINHLKEKVARLEGKIEVLLEVMTKR